MARQLSDVRADIATLASAARRSSYGKCAACGIPAARFPRFTIACGWCAPNEAIIFVSPAPVAHAVSEAVDGIVINLNAYGATVRLENGDLASAPPADVEAHRVEYQRSLVRRKRLAFELRRDGRRPIVALAPQIRDDELDEQIASYLKSTQEWEAPDGVARRRSPLLAQEAARGVLRIQAHSDEFVSGRLL